MPQRLALGRFAAGASLRFSTSSIRPIMAQGLTIGFAAALTGTRLRAGGIFPRIVIAE